MDSALSFSQKRTILTQECLRRLRNTKIELGPDIQKKHLDEFMLKLKVSKYSQKFRTEVLDSAIKAFEKMQQDDKNGLKPMYRSRDWNAEERKSEARERSSGGTQTIIKFSIKVYYLSTQHQGEYLLKNSDKGRKN